MNKEQEKVIVLFQRAEGGFAKYFLLQTAFRFVVIDLDQILRGTTKLDESVLFPPYHA